MLATMSVQTASGMAPMMFWHAVPLTDTFLTNGSSLEERAISSRIRSSMTSGIVSPALVMARFSLMAARTSPR